MVQLLATKSPSEEFSYTNCVFYHTKQFDPSVKYVSVTVDGFSYVFRGKTSDQVALGKAAFGLGQRKWCNLSLDQQIDVQEYKSDWSKSCLASCNLLIDFLAKKNFPKDPFNSDEMAKEFGMHFMETPLTEGQHIMFKFKNKAFTVDVKEISTLSMEGGAGKKVKCGLIVPNTVICFERHPDSGINLIGKASRSQGGNYQSIINPDWDFNKMGIGGLDREFSAIFRRTFASRMFPPEIAEQLGHKHVRGILLFGPPGTGKTLMARQIGKMLNAREPKIVNGPSILDKYVGESEANIRKLFADAEEEAKRMGPNSALHIIIFDEIDAICKARGSVGGGTAVHDTVVNQLLAKIDGVEQLNNVLVIGMTNRRDMIDEALLRPGRLEMQMEISLPDENGRMQILTIHTAKMRECGKLAEDVSIEELAKKTKNFSGAELEGVCRAAAFTAMYQLIKPSGDTKDMSINPKVDPDAFEKLKVKRSDFIHALEQDIKPQLGTQEEELNDFIPQGIINWGEPVSHLLNRGLIAVEAARDPEDDVKRPITLLLEGAPKTGKTALAVEIARRSEFPFIKVVTSVNMIGFSESAKCLAIKKIFDDACKSQLSAVIVDNIEGLIEYNPVGPRFSNYIVQALRDIISRALPAGRRMLVIGTTSDMAALREQRLDSVFDTNIRCSMLSTPAHLVAALEEGNRLTPEEREQIGRRIGAKHLMIGIKHLLNIITLISKVSPGHRVNAFLCRLEEDQCLTED